MRRLIKSVKLFFIGALGSENGREKLLKRAHYKELDLITLILSEEIGIPNPLYYHTVELLPYLSNSLKSFRESEKESSIWRVLSETGEP
ncbi:hypothetical protein [Thermovibrio sp.]